MNAHQLDYDCTIHRSGGRVTENNTMNAKRFPNRTYNENRKQEQGMPYSIKLMWPND